jgi:hypothetical protein
VCLPAAPRRVGPPKSKAGHRIVGIPTAIVPDLTLHLQIYVRDEPRGADKTITNAIDTHVEDEKRKLDAGGATRAAG